MGYELNPYIATLIKKAFTRILGTFKQSSARSDVGDHWSGMYLDLYKWLHRFSSRKFASLARLTVNDKLLTKKWVSNNSRAFS